MPYHKNNWMQSRNPQIWSLSSSMPIEDFVSLYPPSSTMGKSGGRDGYMWVINSYITDKTDWGKLTGRPGGIAGEDAIKATGIWRDALWRGEEIRNDTSIPQSVAKEDETTKPSKAYLLQKLNTDTEEALRNIAAAGRWTSGKWLFFVPDSLLDEVWAELATSIINGPLSRLESAKCQSIKTATNSNPKSKANAQTIISLYFEDCFNKDHATEVAHCCVTKHGLLPVSVKPDLWTVIGIDAGNELKFRPTVYHVGELLKKDVTRGAKDLSALANKELSARALPGILQTTANPSLNDRVSTSAAPQQPSVPPLGTRSPNGSDAGSFHSDVGSYVVDKHSDCSDEQDWGGVSQARAQVVPPLQPTRATYASLGSTSTPYNTTAPQANHPSPSASASGRQTPPWAKNYKKQAAHKGGDGEEEDPFEAVLQKRAAKLSISRSSKSAANSEHPANVETQDESVFKQEDSNKAELADDRPNEKDKEKSPISKTAGEASGFAIPGDFPIPSHVQARLCSDADDDAPTDGRTITIQLHVPPQCVLM